MPERALKESQVATCDINRLGFVLHQHVNHAVAVLAGAGTDLLWFEHTEPATFDHGRTAHADVAACCCNDQIAATQQRCIACKTASCCDTNHRYLPIEPRKAGKSADVQTRHDRHVGVARSAATAFGKQQHRQLLLQGNTQQPICLLVVAHALRAGQDGGVIRHDDRAAGLRAEQRAVDAADTGDHAVGWGVFNQVFFTAAAALCCNGQGAILHERVGIAKIGNVFACAAQAQRMAFFQRRHAARVCGFCMALAHTLQGLAQNGWRNRNVLRRQGSLRRYSRRHLINGGQLRAGFHLFAGQKKHLRQTTRAWGADLMLHLHGFEHHQQLARQHGRTRLNLPENNLGLEGGDDGAHAGIVRARSRPAASTR